MARSLGTVALPDGTGDHGIIQWAERHQSHQIAQQADRTLGGGLVIYQQQIASGLPITLVADERTCWLTQAQRDALLAMANQIGATYPLVWDSETYTVMFRHHEPPAVTLEPLWPEHNTYTGEIRLMTV